MADTFALSTKYGIFLNYSDPQRAETWNEKILSGETISDVIDEYDNPLKNLELALVSLSTNEINGIALARKSTTVATKKNTHRTVRFFGL